MTDEKKLSFGAWKRQTAKGEVINFAINGTRYSMWANSYKSDDKQPDFKIYINEYVASAETQLTEVKTDLPF
jgi:hypothetical protein